MIQERVAVPRIISICSHKGGVGKSATAVNLAACLAMKRKKVLLIDLDPQSTASDALGVDTANLDRHMYDVFMNRASIRDVIRPTEIPSLDIAPSNMDLRPAEKSLESQDEYEFILKKRLASLDGHDFIIIDTPPNLGPMTINAMATATELLVPVQCEYCAVRGMLQLMSIADLAEKYIENSPKRRLLLTMYTRTNIGNKAVDEVRANYGKDVYLTVIPRAIKMAEAPFEGKPIVVLSPSSTASQAYKALAEEVLRDE
jgi:chromosome partitioning protein